MYSHRQQELNRQLCNAVRDGNIKKIKHMIIAGADVNTKTAGDWFERTPLHIAAYYNNVQVARILIDANANLDSLDEQGDTPLHRAVLNNNVEVARMLITAGAKINIPNEIGNTPRQYARTPEMREVFIEADSILQSKAIFSHAMQEGWVDINILRIAIMGPPATGKTSFLHLLFNWAAPKHHHSTPIGNRPIRAIQRVAAHDEGNVWSTIGIPELKQMMAEAAQLLGSSDGGKVIPNLSHQQTSVSQFTSEVVDNPSCIEGEGEIYNYQAIFSHSATKVETRSSISTHTDMDNDDVGHSKLIPDPLHFPEEVLQSLAEGNISSSLHQSTWINVLDSGGQPQFADISRAFIHDNVINIIVLKLTQRLDDKPTFVYSINGKQLTQPAVLQMTYIQLIQSFVRSTVSSKYTVSKKLEEVKPLFVIVGTYLDHTHGIKGFLKSLESLAEKNRQLVHALREYKEHLVFYNEHNEELIFPVDNLCKWNRKKISSEIHHRITCSNKPIPIHIPIRWYMFEVKVKEESLKVAHGMVTLDTCEQIGIKLGMGKQEVSQCIEYLNSFSLFLYFPVLPHVVFTNPQYLLDIVTSLVRVSFIDYPEELLTKDLVLPPGTQRELIRKGLFSEELLLYLSLEFFPNLFTKSHLIDLLQYLFIIAPVRETTPFLFFLPSGLPTRYLSEEEKKEFSQSCEPLLLCFKHKVIPQGVFAALVVALMKRSTSPIFTLHEHAQQLRYSVHLDSEDLDGSVGLMDCHNWLEIYYTGLPGTRCRTILQAIREVLLSCASVLHYDKSVAHVTPTLRCQNDHKTSIPPHPAKVSFVDGKLLAKCTEQPTLPPIQLTEMRYVSWFDEKDSNEGVPEPHISSLYTVSQDDTVLTGAHDPLQRDRGTNSPHLTPHSQIIMGSQLTSSSHTTPHTTVPVLTTPLKVTSDTNLLPTADIYPHIILKKHTSELLGIISDPDKLAVDMWSADLVPDPVKENVLTTTGLSRFLKSSELLDEVYRSLKVFKRSDILVKFCEVLKIQRNAGLTRIADDMLKQLSGL